MKVLGLFLLASAVSAYAGVCPLTEAGTSVYGGNGKGYSRAWNLNATYANTVVESWFLWPTQRE